jgi:phage gp46-like protein
MTDVLLYQTLDDGDVSIDGGQVQLTDGLETAVYLSLFGGNEADDGLPDNPHGWWGNEGEGQDARMVSRLQNLMGGLPASSANLKRLNDAASADLAWLTTRYSVAVSASIPGINRVKMTVAINGQTFEFTEEWARR